MQRSDDFVNRGGPRRRYIPIAQDLLQQAGALADPQSGRLPSDRELAEKYGVGRGTIREALFALDLVGAIDVRHGDGTYVSKRTPQLRTSEQFRYGALPEHVIDTRIVLEPTIARWLAIETHSAPDATQSLEAAEQIKTDLDRVPEFTRHAIQFHLDLAESIENRLMGELAFEVIAIDQQPLWALINQLALRSHDNRDRLQAEHRAILAAISSGDGDAAATAMQLHLENNKDLIIPGSPAT